MMDLFMATAETTTPLIAFDEKGITYLAAINAGWLPYPTILPIGVRGQCGLD